MYKEKLQSMIIKGVIGFIIGFAFAYFSFETTFEFWGGCTVGICFAGLPYGWELFGKILGGWIIGGELAVLVIAFMIRLIGSLLLGWISYPIALVFYIIKAIRE